LPFSIKKLVAAIGDSNIIKAEYTHTKVKIYIHSTKQIDMEQIKKIKSISGTFTTSNSFTIIVGNSAKTISTQLNKFISE
jgi:phosphotransferase system IIB component